MEEGAKQMGPALLPTPLSPTRGRLVLGVAPASRPFTLFKTRLASDVSRRSRSVLHSAPEGPSFRHARRQFSASGFVTGARAGIRPPPSHKVHASTQPGLCSGAPLVFQRSRDCLPIRFSISNGRLRFDPLAPSIAIQARSLAR